MTPTDSQRPGRRRAQVGFAGLLGAVILVVGAKASSGRTASARSALTGLPVTPHAGPTTPAAASPPVASGRVRTVTGDPVGTRYGPVQVQLILAGTKITNVVSVQLPNTSGRDLEIDSAAVPELRQEVLAAQSAQIDTVSGASYTSQGYAQSVQSALDRARG